MRDTAAVSEGTLSNAGAHFNAAAGWIEHAFKASSTKDAASGIAGTFANIGGMLGAGVYDAQKRKLGK